jgi:hypothetical protein
MFARLGACLLAIAFVVTALPVETLAAPATRSGISRVQGRHGHRRRKRARRHHRSKRAKADGIEF